MNRDPISATDFRPSFSGHETFPLRQLWLRKAYLAVLNYQTEHSCPAPKNLFSDEDSISRFGAGKNMVYAMRHWAIACGILIESDGGYEVTALGRYLFDQKVGKDPYQERMATVWLIQWLISSTPEYSTTWYWAFNRFNSPKFTRSSLEKSIIALIEIKSFKRLTPETIKRDVQCFVRSYCSTRATRDDDFRTESIDDLAEPILSELGLLSPMDDGSFLFRRGQKLSLPDGVFNYALHRFWNRFSPNTSTLSFDSLAYEPGSPALVFKLDEDALAERLLRIGDSSGGKFEWSDTAGLRQIVKKKRITGEAMELLEPAYSKGGLANGTF